MSDYYSRHAEAAQPYVPGEQPRGQTFIKLNTNENAYPPSPEVGRAVEAALMRLRLYPPADGREFREALATREGLPLESVFVGNGSDEVLALAFRAFFDEARPVATPAVGYSFYPVYARLYDIPLIRIPMLSGLRVDVDALCGDGQSSHGVALANPNAPTGIALTLDEVARIASALRARSRVLLLDEAYADFAKERASGLVEEFDNLLIIRTLSKSHALAGLRVGYCLGAPGLIEGIVRIKDSFNSYPLDHLAIAGAAAAIRDEAYFAERRDAILHTREAFSAGLRALGFEVLPSGANFVFARHQSRDAAALVAFLRGRGILVRHFAQPGIDQYLRITIGTDAEMEAVIAALREAVS